MPADVTRGHTYLDGDTVTGLNLADLVASGVIANIDRSNTDRTHYFPITQAAEAPPGLTILEPWQHATTLWLIANKSASTPASLYGNATRVNPLAGLATWDAGMVLKTHDVDGAGRLTMDKCPADEPWTAMGIAVTDGGSNKENLVTLHGVCRIRLKVQSSASGIGLKMSDTDGLAEIVSTTRGTGTGRDVFAMGISNPSNVGGDFWTWAYLKR